MSRMNSEFSYNTFLPWKCKQYTDEYKVGGGFASALKELGAIKTEYGKIKLTEKFRTLRASTVRKKMNQQMREWNVKNPRRNGKRINVVQTKMNFVPVLETIKVKPTSNEDQIQALIQAAKSKAREELMQELLSKLMASN